VRVLRVILVMLSVITAFWVVHDAVTYHVRPIWPAFAIPIALALNVAYLVLSEPRDFSKTGHKESRIRRLFRLWLDAKESELRARAQRDNSSQESGR